MSIHDKVEFHPWNSEPEVGDFFESLVKLHNIQSFLEIGVFQGLTTYNLLSVLKCRLVGIDVEDLRLDIVKKEWKKNKSWFIQNDSLTVLKVFAEEGRRFDCIFIDSLHDYNQCSQEYWLSARCMNKDGLVIFHDSTLHEGIVQFVEELKQQQLKLNIELLTLNTPSVDGRGGASGITIVRHL